MSKRIPQTVLEPLEFHRSARATTFSALATGTVEGNEVMHLGHRIGWVWWSDAEHAAGWLTDRAWAQHNITIVSEWVAALAELATSQGTPSQARELSEQISACELGTPIQSTLRELWQQAGRPFPASEELGDIAAEAMSGSPVSRRTLDAGLRGQVPASPAMVAQISSLDQALQRQPVPTTIVATRGTSLSSWPGEPEALKGEIFTERAFLPVLLGNIDGPDVECVVHFTVPAGVPAVFVPGPDEATLGTLLLARGLEWEVDHVEQSANGIWRVGARIVGAPT